MVKLGQLWRISQPLMILFIFSNFLHSFGEIICENDSEDHHYICKGPDESEDNLILECSEKFKYTNVEISGSCSLSTPHCVNFCQDIEDLKSELLRSPKVLDSTYRLISDTLNERKCEGKGSRFKYCCSEKELDYSFEDGLYLLVTAGWSKDKQIKETEVIDLKNPFSICSKEPDFPAKTKGMVYAKISESEVLVCGGSQDEYDETPTSECFLLNFNSSREHAWIPSNHLTERRSDAAGIFLQKEKIFFIAGGTNRHPIVSPLPSSEISSVPNGEWEEGFNLPQGYGISNHCLVRMRDGKIILIGGLINNSENVTSDVWILDWHEKNWTKLPSMRNPRMDAGCGIISLRDGSEAVVVAGGRKGPLIYSSSEIFFYEKSETWEAGPDLPIKLTGAQMVQVPFKAGGQSVLLVGGYFQRRIPLIGGGFSSDIHYLDRTKSNSFEWQTLKSRLEIPRYDHVAVTITRPDDYCT